MSRDSRNSLNFMTLAVFAPVLIVAGIAGFVVPAQYSLTSGTPAYNVFHLVFGCLGLFLVWIRNELWISSFNFGFGLIDLYQAVASIRHWPPEQYFLWTRVDDILHILIGLALMIIGAYGILKRTRLRKEKQV